MKLPENHWLYDLKAEILKIEPTAQLILYGSRARGDAKPDSDWDLLLLTEKNKVSFELEDALRMPVTLKELELAEVLSLQIFNKSEWHTKFRITPYYENIQREGILV
jgi:predicted nucleotidyltransferase